MAGKPITEVEGARRLRRTLRQASDDLSDLKAAHAAVAAIAAEAARARVPRLTGRLAGTIRSSGTKTAGIVRVGNNRRVRYAGPIHWGWPDHHIKANPFASEGAQASQPRWILVYEKAVTDAIDHIRGE